MSSTTSKKILLLAANPKGTTRLRLDEEVREIDAGLQRAQHRDHFILEQKWAVRPRDIQRAILDTNPSIVHFFGHGTGDEGLVFEDEAGIAKLVDGEALAGLFELFAEQVECVVLNSCYSEVQAEAIARHVNYVIGMSKAISDRAGIEFAVGFYDALGAGRPVEFAHKFGCAAIRLAGIPEHLTPVLKKKPGIGETVAKISSPSEQPSSTKSATFVPYTAPMEVFFSYSHKDEQLRDELAKHLSILKRQGIITAWHDREISAGTEWACEIDTHLNTARIILLLISADFLASDYCYDMELTRAMERHAAKEARVIPVILREVDWKGAPFGQLQALPKDAVPVTNWENRDQAFADIARGIRKAVESPPDGTQTEDQQDQVPLSKLSNVPELPPHFLPRPEELQSLKDIVLGEKNQQVVVTGRMQRVGVQGMGGIGKTVLATAVARDDSVRRAFGDGVFWLTFGQTPELSALQLQLAKALGFDTLQPFTNHSDGAACLRELLASKTCLLILDDVWQTKHLQAFEALGQNCQILITTRKSELITSIGGSKYQLDVLSNDQALTLLAVWAEQGVETLPSEAHSVAQECDNLPLALAMIGAMVRDKPDRWGNVLHKLRHADLEKIQQDFPHYPYPNLLKAIEVSVDDLGPEMRRQYLDFAVFPEDTPIPEGVLQTLWESQGLAQDKSQDVVYKLVERSLAKKDESGRLTLHDLQLDYVHNKCDDLTKLHSQLLEVYIKKTGVADFKDEMGARGSNFISRFVKIILLFSNARSKTKEELWHTLPNDGYIHARLTWHLEKAGWVDEIHNLLRQETKDGRNSWHEACERIGQTANFVTSVAHARGLAEKMFEECPSQAIALQCRYALILTTLNSLTANLPPTLLVALLQKRVWAPEQGLAYALQSSNPENKASLLTAIIDDLPQKLKEKALQEALAAARAIQDERYRATALSALASNLPALLPEALAAARAIQSEQYRAIALSALADKLPEVLPEALAAARAIQDERYRAEALSALADKLPEVLPEALAAARAIQDERYRAEVLSALASQLPPELLPEALAAARAIQDEKYRADALSALASHRPEVLPEALAAARAIQDERYRATALSALASKLPEVLPEALAAARAIQDELYRAIALSALASHLPELLPEALAAARAIQTEDVRATVLSALASYLPPELLPEALAAARAIQSEQYRATVLSALAYYLPPELLPEALAAARAIQSERHRATVLSALASKLPELLPEALAAARAIQDEWQRATVLSALASKLPELLPEALAAARAIQDEWQRATVLSALASKLPELLPEALAAARAIQDEGGRAYALSALADKLPPELLPEALAAARAIQDERHRARALSALADKLPPELLPEALAAARAIQDEGGRAYALSALADKLPPELLPEALAAARAIQDEGGRAYALSALSSHRPEVLPEALAAARAIQDEGGRAYALSALSSHRPEVLPEALAAARAIQDEGGRAYALSALSSHLPEVLPEALTAARAIQDEFYRAEALSALADKLPELLPEALAAARAIQDEPYRAYALRALASHLPPELLSEALAAARAIQDENSRATALSALASHLPPELLSEALAAARAIQDENSRATALSALASHLPPELLPKALAAARAIQSERHRATVLSALAGKLPEVLPEALAAARAIQDKYYRADALSALADKLSNMQPGELFPLWQNTLHSLSLRTRGDFLQDIAALAPVICALGDRSAVAKVARAIQDVSRWWP